VVNKDPCSTESVNKGPFLPSGSWVERALGSAGMNAIRLVLLYIHLIGFALLLGGAVTQY
jgi:hypothetical protein